VIAVRWAVATRLDRPLFGWTAPVWLAVGAGYCVSIDTNYLASRIFVYARGQKA
jgi:hypothetical protein